MRNYLSFLAFSFFHFLILSFFFHTFAYSFALVAELVDAPDLGSGISDVQVRVLSGAQRERELHETVPFFRILLWR